VWIRPNRSWGPHKKAAGSQALSELKKQFCDQRRCLECDIGKQLLQPDERVKN